MTSFLKDIFSYQHHFNQEIIEFLSTHEDHSEGKNRALISHMLNAHQIWNSRIAGAQALGVHDLHSLEHCLVLDDQNFEKTLEILKNHALSESVVYSTSQGRQYENTVLEILFHASNHHTHHRGQIVANLRRGGITPPMTDYIFYKR
ncbi:damage-inducible protein DinB [Marinilongibacter aquaticus]|uniref:DinB family protein n=1 Tax=Marinilongibacter aquaticus TaxID=2975157 RepID=UPI0021BDE6CE|nr:DinB family protein [Marinilongibacter aquaticus]UBM58291.1 damage-inducible protein DinB [Marinilongibacter aquaticus]